jgi:hypothetical protein
MLDFDRFGGVRAVPAGAREPVVRARDAYFGALAALQLGEGEAACGSYRLLRGQGEAAPGRAALASRWGARGRHHWAADALVQPMGDEAPYLIHLAYLCFGATRQASWLAAELPALRRLALLVQQADRDGDGLPETRSDASWSGLSPLASDSAYAVEDPYAAALSAAALARLAELEDWASPGAGAAWTQAAARTRTALTLLWRPEREWFAFHSLPDNSRSFDEPHLQAVEVFAWGQASAELSREAVRQLLRARWWDAGARSFLPVPGGSSWAPPDPDATLGISALDFRAAGVLLRYGSGPEERAPAFRRLDELAGRVIRTNFGRVGARHNHNGLSMAAAGALVDLVGRSLFGVDERLDEVAIAPNLGGIADHQEWRLDGWRIAGDSLSLWYRPADRAATLRVGAPRRVRLALRFPWLSASGCVSVRRGAGAAELLPMVALADGSFYVDVRAGFDPAELRVTAAACAPA